MNITHPTLIVRLFAAMLIVVTVIILSTLAAHAPAQNQSSLTLKSIRTDNTAVFYADHRPDCAWFREMVLPTGDSKLMAENLQSVAATL